MKYRKLKLDQVERKIEQYAADFTQDIGEEIETAFEDTWKDFAKVLTNWRHDRGDDDNASPFMMEASNGYWMRYNTGTGSIDITPTDEGYQTGIELSPNNIKREIYSGWSLRRSRKDKKRHKKRYSKKAVFEMMFYHGIWGYSKEIVANSWYKTKSSQKRYYRRYHLKGISNPSRQTIMDEIEKANIIPPTADIAPFDNMNKKFKAITDSKYLDKKWEDKFAPELDNEIKKMLRIK